MAFLPVLALATVCAQAPTGEEIARNLSARAARDAVSTFTTKYRKEWYEEDLSDADNPRVTKYRLWSIVGNGASFTQTVGKDSTGERPIGYAEDKFADARRMFVARYDFKVVEPCLVHNGPQRLWVVSYTPRIDVALPKGEKEDDLLNSLRGRMYVDAEKWFVFQAIGELVQPFSRKIVGKVTAAKVWMDQDDKDGVVLLRHISIEVWYEYLWPFDKKQHHIRQVYQFFRQPPETASHILPQ